MIELFMGSMLLINLAIYLTVRKTHTKSIGGIGSNIRVVDAFNMDENEYKVVSTAYLGSKEITIKAIELKEFIRKSTVQ